MNILSLIDSTSKQLISPVAQREKQRREDREQAQLAEKRHQQAEYIRTVWLEALMHDALLIGFEQAQPKLQATLNSARTGLVFVMYGLIDERSDRATMEKIIETILGIQEVVTSIESSPPSATLKRWAANIETAREALRAFKPIQILQASFTMHERHPALIAHGVQLEVEAKFAPPRKTLGVKNHLVTFGQAA